MGQSKTPGLAELLRLTLEELVKDTTRADDPAMVKVKRLIIRTIAELRLLASWNTKNC